MTQNFPTLLFSIALLAVSACASDRDRVNLEAADVEAIKAAFTGWVKVAEAGDAQGYGRFITDDAIFLGPGSAPIAGKDTLIPWLAGWFAEWQFSFPEWNTEEVIVAGDIAIHRYSGVATLTPKRGGEATVADRKYIDILRREADGQWRVARHMFNLNR